MKFGLMFFASSEDALVGDKYSLVIESAQFGDRHGFSSIWTPERHFTKFGSLYPNPAVLNAVLARETRHIRLQAGSVVLPIHDPIRIAEEWAVVDNLSAGRVGISFASGWNPNDFVFFPEKYKDRHKELFNGIEVVQKLWQGESIQVTNGNGNQIDIRIYPTPVQPELPIWITAASNPLTFIKAGEIGANLLTHLLDQDIEELADKITLYRQARAKHGHNPEGIVSIMLHTFVGQDFNVVHEQVRVPYCEYLKSNIGLLKGLAQSRGSRIDISTLSEKDLDDFVNFLFERFASSRGLIGTPETCLDLLRQLDSIGVDEVSCLLDFGPSKNLILEHLPHLNQLRELYNTEVSDKNGSVVNLNITNTNSIFLDNPEKAILKTKILLSTAETLPEIRKQCTKHKSAEEFYKFLYKHGLRLGRTFQGIENLWLGKKEALAQVKLQLTESNSYNSLRIHPPLLEACHQVLLATLLDKIHLTNEPSLYLPMGFKSFQIYEPMSNQIWSHALLSNVDIKESIEGDVRIFDENGKLLLEVFGLQMQRVEHLSHQTSIKDNYANWFYELQWELKPLVKLESSPIREPGSWIVFADRLGIGKTLAKLLEAQGQTCFVVHCRQEDRTQVGQILLDPADPKAMQKLIEQMKTQLPCRGVVHLWSLDTTPTEETTISSLEKDQTLALTSTLHLVQALLRTNTSELPLLWLVTRGTQKIGSEADLPAIAQAATWGLGRSLSIEMPHIWGGLVDIDRQFSIASAAKALFEQLWHQDGESQIALQSDTRYVARLVPSQNVQINTQPLSLHSDATYLITGGLGHLGLNTARWMVDKGARNIVLMGRSDASSTARQAIAQLEDNGAQVLVVKADVCNQADVDRIFEKIKAYYPPLRGIFHAAGVAGFHPLQDMTPDAIKSVLNPKVVGTWNLHQITLGMKLDFFVCISSIASVWGSEGLAHYAAASHFLDIFAHYRHSLKLPALTVNVGALSGGGMHHHQDFTRAEKLLAQIGLKYYSPEDLLKTVEYCLERGAAQQVIIDIDWAIFKELYEARERRTLLKQIKVQSEKPFKGQSGQLGEVLQQLENASEGDRYGLLIAYLQARVAKVLKLKDSQLPTPEQGLTQMGMDSLTAVELKNGIQKELGIDIPIIQFIGGTTIAALATELNKQLTQGDRDREIEFSTDEQNSDWIEGEI